MKATSEDVFLETTASRRLVDLIEHSADELTTRYVKDTGCGANPARCTLKPLRG